MKVTGLHVDGYGVLADLDIGPLRGGLSVILGANEAGKSTLLDFLRGVLFGFPDRRHRSPFHEPLHGGRHGGMLRLEDAQGATWLLERHVDRRQPLLSGPDGHPRDASALRALLGGADETLFRSVFAFGLGELSNFETLDKDEVRELVFSAGVLGAGRSATQAIRALEQQRSLIVRPRQQDALANQLRRRLEELDQHLVQARTSTAAFETARTECDRLADAAKAARQQSESLHRRARELERLQSCWAPWHRREEAVSALLELGSLARPLPEIVDAGVEIRALVDELSGHDERRRLAESLESQLAGIERELELRLAEIGFDAATRVLPPLDIGLEEHLSELARHHREAHAARKTLEEELERANIDLSCAREELTDEQAKGPARSGAALEEVAIDTKELRGLLATLDRLEIEEAGRRQEEALAAIALARPTNRHGLSVGAVAAIVALSAALCTVAALSHRRTQVLIIIVGAALLVGLVLLGRSLGRRAPTAKDEPTIADGRDGRAGRVATSIEAIATSLGLPARPEAAEIEGHATVLEAEREHRRRLDELTRTFDRARTHVAALTTRLELASVNAAALGEEVRNIAEKLDLSPQLTPEGLRRAIDAMRRAYGLIAASARVAPELSSLCEATASYERGLGALLERLGMPSLRREALADTVRELAEQLEEARRAEEQRNQLTREVATADGVLDEALGSGADAERLRTELASGAVLQWAEEQRALERLLAEADQRYDASLTAQHDGERTLRDLLGSDEIASLQLEREGVAAELEAALERWLVLGLSAALLQKTLSRYEAERQPLVISRAAELFREVTSGRYVQLVAREDADPHHHGIEVIGPAGDRVDSADLSRGAAEALYLCLRLAFASTFAARAASLPLVLDDVLVNFDPERAGAMARAIVGLAGEHQVVVFTCHPHVVDYFSAASHDLDVIKLDRRDR